MCALVTGVQTCALPIYFGKTVRQIVQRDAPLGSRSIQTLNRQTRLPFHAPVAGNNPHHELLRIRMQCPPIALVPFRLFRRYQNVEHTICIEGQIIEVILVKRGMMLASAQRVRRSEEHTSELQYLMRISSALLCLPKKKYKITSITAK